jgi:ribose 5-phosphate isomerase A
MENHGQVDRVATEAELNSIAGVVTNVIFARRAADVLLLGSEQGVTTTSRK